MTAEIAVLNRNAVALAADSAVTLQLPEGPKIYQTNKLFTVSKYRPVGIMVYGSADFMGVPWEVVVKLYRSRLGRRGFPRLEDYANNFLDFLEGSPRLFPPERQESFCRSFVRAWIGGLKDQLKQEVSEKIDSSGPVSGREVRLIFREIVEDEISRLRGLPSLPRFPKGRARSLLRGYRAVIREVVADELERLAGAVPVGRIEEGCLHALTRVWALRNGSGIVIAGFGDREFLPRLRTYQLDAVIAGRLRVLENKGKRCQIDQGALSAAVVAFAQSEMVTLFMNGIDGDYSDFMREFISHSLVTEYPGLVGRILGTNLKPAQRSAVLRRLRRAGRQLASELESARAEYEREMHSDPIVEIVNHLPKEELAAMAEALVNLTSFKRHITRHPETVGGPIDVAVISRGDGFIWIKRKHYFRRELNQQFFANYFRGNATNTKGGL